MITDIDADVSINGAKHDARRSAIELRMQRVKIVATPGGVPLALEDTRPNRAMHRFSIEETARIWSDAPCDRSILIQDRRRLGQRGTRGYAHIAIAALDVHAIFEVDCLNMPIFRSDNHYADAFDANIDIDRLKPRLKMIGLRTNDESLALAIRFNEVVDRDLIHRIRSCVPSADAVGCTTSDVHRWLTACATAHDPNMACKVVDVHIGESADWNLDLLVLMHMAVECLVPDTPKAIPETRPTLCCAGRHREHDRCRGHQLKRGSTKWKVSPRARAAGSHCNKLTSPHVSQSSGQSLYDPASSMLLVVVPMSLALLTPPRAAPLPQPAATPIALPVPASADPMQRERRDKMPMFDAAPSGRTFPSDDIRVIVRPSSEGLLTDPLLPGRLIICVRAVAGAQALPPAATVFDAPLQPVGSFALQPSDGSATIDCSQGGVWWPCPPEALDGLFDVQAVIPEGGTGCDLDAAGN